MVYGREVDGETLELEASGALIEASLVMRDRQTDSWWSIMSSEAIGGPLEGTRLSKLPGSRKTTWGEWRKQHPDSLVLSVNGIEHIQASPYDNYLTSSGTFRGIDVEDDRLPAKEPVFTFRLDDTPWAIPHASLEGGRVTTLPDDPRQLLLFREAGASMYASTEAWLVTRDQDQRPLTVSEMLEQARSGAEGFVPLEGFDTFWYTWVGVNEDSRLLQ